MSFRHVGSGDDLLYYIMARISHVGYTLKTAFEFPSRSLLVLFEWMILILNGWMDE